MADYPQTSFSSSAPVALPDMSAQQDTASLGVQIQGLLSHNQQLDQAIAKTMPAALNPVMAPGASAAKLPQHIGITVGQPNLPAPQGSRDARNQGIAKTVSGVANIISGYVKAKQAEKTRDLAHDIERVMGAQDAMSQAAATLKGDPNNQDAKAAVEKNKQIINDIVGADPKRLKQFEKAFSIDHMKPEENTGPEHDARKMAAKSFAEKLQAQTPDKQVPNEVAQRQLQTLAAQKQANEVQLKSLIPLYNQQQKDAQAMQRVVLQQSEANARTDATNQTRAAVAEHHDATIMADSLQRSRDMLKAVDKREAGENARTFARIDARNKQIDKVIGSKPEQAAKLDAQNAKEINDVLKQSAQDIRDNEILKADALKANKHADVSQFDAAINKAKELQKTGYAWMQEYTNRSNSRAGGKELDPQPQKGAPSGGTPGSTNSTKQPESKTAATLKYLLGEDEDDSDTGSDSEATNPDNY